MVRGGRLSYPYVKLNNLYQKQNKKEEK